MASVTPGNKINHTDMPTLIGSPVVIRSLVDFSERRGIVKAYDATSGKVRVNQGRNDFWASAVNKATEYVFIPL